MTQTLGCWLMCRTHTHPPHTRIAATSSRFILQTLFKSCDFYLLKKQNKRMQRMQTLINGSLDLTTTNNNKMREYRDALQTLGSEAAGRVGLGVGWSAKLRDAKGVRRDMRIVPPVYEPFSSALSEAREALRSSMTDASILEHRAMMTGQDDDLEAFKKSLAAVDDAVSRAWALEAWGALRKRFQTQFVRSQLQERIDALMKERAAKISKPNATFISAVSQSRSVHEMLQDTFAPKDSDLRLLKVAPSVGDPAPTPAPEPEPATATQDGSQGGAVSTTTNMTNMTNKTNEAVRVANAHYSQMIRRMYEKMRK